MCYYMYSLIGINIMKAIQKSYKCSNNDNNEQSYDQLIKAGSLWFSAAPPLRLRSSLDDHLNTKGDKIQMATIR